MRRKIKIVDIDSLPNHRGGNGSGKGSHCGHHNRAQGNLIYVKYGLGCPLGGGNCFTCSQQDCRNNARGEGKATKALLTPEDWRVSIRAKVLGV